MRDINRIWNKLQIVINPFDQANSMDENENKETIE
tara:strand:+ start:257 stop:361 length:105 start_codon:yes stop_codon:yes gene_type:complete